MQRRSSSAPAECRRRARFEDAATQTKNKPLRRVPGIPGLTYGQANQLVPTQMLHMSQITHLQQQLAAQQEQLTLQRYQVNQQQEQMNRAWQQLQIHHRHLAELLARIEFQFRLHE